ncbi:hypothetical protein [Catenuloplanes atrovinosus]|uniref:Secreted protein n=1 Tax=Catenuloplanes atrovinosus TaxID=137266 RepID=A0AAE4C958_9ACTN|nr:hypothetical protein [Catenuloplanes atrovinosus]MDR7276221.1 hypothetical protein [Catenuloplanes atrovinosus]
MATSRTGVLFLISIGLWACVGCASHGPADTSGAEPPAPAHCAPLSGDPLPSMCAPAGHPPAGGSRRAAEPAAQPPEPGRAGRPDRHRPSSAGTRDAPQSSGAADRVTRDTVPVTAEDDAEPVSPELMPEAPFSGWGVAEPPLPAPGDDAPPVVLEHAPADPGTPAERTGTPGETDLDA